MLYIVIAKRNYVITLITIYGIIKIVMPGWHYYDALNMYQVYCRLILRILLSIVILMNRKEVSIFLKSNFGSWAYIIKC